MMVAEVTSAAEDYLKTIYALNTRGVSSTTSSIAEHLDVSAPSVSAMVKRLAAMHLVVRSEDGQVVLTPEGRAHALRVVRRHRLLETFLARVLDVPWDEVHAEAEQLEHAVGEKLEDRIDTLLGYPTHDPHGDPIPPKRGEHRERWADPLAAAGPGTRFVVERVSDRDSAALRYLDELGIRPSVTLTVLERAPFGGPLWVLVDGTRHALGSELLHLVFGTVQEQG